MANRAEHEGGEFERPLHEGEVKRLQSENAWLRRQLEEHAGSDADLYRYVVLNRRHRSGKYVLHKSLPYAVAEAERLSAKTKSRFLVLKVKRVVGSDDDDCCDPVPTSEKMG